MNRARPIGLLFVLAVVQVLWAVDDTKPSPASTPSSRPITASAPARATSQPFNKQAVLELVGLLGDDNFKVREEATQKLIRMGGVIYPLLATKLADKSLEGEAAIRVRTVLEDLSSWPLDAKEAARRQDEMAQSLGIAKELTLDLGSKVTMKLVLIPAGTFLMGSPEDEQDRGEQETQHTVIITKPFFIGVYAVTQNQYEQVMGKNPSTFKGAMNPVENVEWDDAVEFCKRLSQKIGKTVQLPTEAQWEYACRAGTATPFNTGETISTDQANYNGDHIYGSGHTGAWRVKTTPVGSFRPNAWGLYDMHGNALQMCSDWYGPYSDSNEADPQGPDTGKWRVLRGGSWFYSPWFCRSAYRLWRTPDAHYFAVGFRVVVSPG